MSSLVFALGCKKSNVMLSTFISPMVLRPAFLPFLLQNANLRNTILSLKYVKRISLPDCKLLNEIASEQNIVYYATYGT